MSTTLLVALAATAQADAVEFDVEGEFTFGVNDRLVNNTYLVGEVEFSAEQSFDNGFGWAVSYELEGEKFGWGTETDYDDAILLEVVTPFGSLAYGDMNKRGASELFYNDVDGMALDVVRYKDGYPSLRWQGDIGNGFSYALSSRNLNNDDDEDYSIGLGYQAGSFEIGLAYDNGSDTQDEAFGATIVYANEGASAETEYTLSYIESGGESSVGLGVEVEFNMGLSVEASYAFNDDAGKDDAYSLAVEYETGPLTLEAEYSNDGEEEYELAVVYEVSGIAPEGTTFYAGYTYEEGSAEDTGYYVAAGFGLAENTVFGIAYSETGEGGDLEVQPGWSAMLTVSF